MDAEIKAEWLQALRSGKYPQGREWLHHHDRYCCLGVLQAIRPALSRSQYGQLIDDSEAAEMGLSHDNQTQLADMNDGGADFGKIADYIEANL
jgi:hypothetical protein